MPYMYCTFNDDKAIRNHFQCDLRLNAWLQDSQEECKIHIILLLLLLSILLYIDECLHVDNSAWYYRYTYRHRDCFIFCVLTLSVRLEFLAFLFKKKTKKKRKSSTIHSILITLLSTIETFVQFSEIFSVCLIPYSLEFITALQQKNMVERRTRSI